MASRVSLSHLSMPSVALINTTVLNKSLSAMVKGIRGHKDRGELEYINKCIAEIKEELSTPYADVKAQALQKLIYLQMIGYDISWASFNIVEVMSAPWFGHKRVGYLAASLCFTKDTDVILLTTHLFRKGFSQPSSTGSAAAEGLQYETGAAIACLSNIATPDLSMDLLNDVYALMNSSRPYIRKKAVLVLLRLFKQWPKALRLSFDRLKEKLQDDNAGVVSAAVYVICELAAKNPKNYLSLAPQFFRILTTSSNNWVLIKVVKLLGSLSPLEPRLAKKLQEPLTDLITTTPAKSLLYECINTLLAGEIRSKTVIRLCLDKLRGFIEDPDQNLKYLGLLGLHRLMRKHPRVVTELRDLVLGCLQDEDVTIRMRALDLITAMVNTRNAVAIVRKMQEHLLASEGVYREHVLGRILQIGAQDNYAYVTDFEWYIGVLVELTHSAGASAVNAWTITQQLTDVSIRVPAVRRYAVKAMSDVLLGGRLLSSASGLSSMSEVLHAAAFIVGEYSEYVEEHVELLRCMTRKELSGLSGETQVVFVQNVIKVLASGLYQPYDVSGEDQDVSMDVKVKDLLGRREQRDDEEEKEEEGDEVKEADEKERERRERDKDRKQDDNDAEPEQEEEELDANGCKKRKVKAKRRSYHDYCVFVGEMLECLLCHLPAFTRSLHVEVQERAVSYFHFVVWLATTAQMQPFISIPIDRHGQAAEAGGRDEQPDEQQSRRKKEANGQPPPSLLDDLPSASSPSSSSQLNDSLPPAALLSSLAVQVNLLFSERLNPVNPKAQRKVPVPKGLNLESVINPGWDADSDRSDEESEEEQDSSSDDDGGKRRRKKKREKERGDKEKDRASRDRKRKDKKGAGAGLFEEESFSKPLTEHEKQEARSRLEARRAAQLNDPYYVKDKPSSSSSSALLSPASASISPHAADDIPVKRLGKDDLPAMHVSSDRKSGSRRSAGRKGAEAEDDIFAGVGSRSSGKVYKVRKEDDMPSGAESSDEEKAGRGGDDDLSLPLGADDVIPTAKPYGSEEKDKKHRSGRRRKGEDKDADRDDNKKRKKKDKDREKDRERSSRGGDERRKDDKDRDRGKDRDREKDRKDSKKDKTGLDDFDPMKKASSGGSSSSVAEPQPASASSAAAAADGGSGDEKEEKEDRKKKKKSRDRDRDREPEKDRKREKEKDRDRERDREKEREKDRDKDREREKKKKDKRKS